MENECEALPGVAYPGVRDNRSTLNTKTGYDDVHTLGKIGRLNKNQKSSSAAAAVISIENHLRALLSVICVEWDVKP